MFLKRDLANSLQEYVKFPVVAFLGPRQSGKTTLAINTFPKHAYLCLEDPRLRSLAINDPERFLSMHENEHGIILDEFQYVPDLLSYVQLEVDRKKRPGYFVLSGSQNFLMNKRITQSLAGRVGILTLLPFSIHELRSNNLQKNNIDDVIFSGCYPRIFDENIAPAAFYPSYIHTYLERDVRDLVKVGDLIVFQKFMELCAGRTGQQLNIADIATNCGISRESVEAWLSVLEASYIVFRLPPYFNNFNKRVTKTPKLYFYDTGLACSLLGITDTKSLSLSPFRGHLFENFIIADLYKQYLNIGRTPPLYFWRDQNGRVEVDCLINTGVTLVPVEIKSSSTISSDYFDQLIAWQEITEKTGEQSYVVYGGNNQAQVHSAGTIMGWQDAGSLIENI